MNKKYAAILLLAAAAVWTSGCSPQPISSQQAKPIQATKAPSAPAIKTDSKAASDEGIKKYQAGDYDKAIEDFDKALALDADNYQASAIRALPWPCAAMRRGVNRTWNRALPLSNKPCS